MAAAFILRFQELCTPDDAHGIRAGTMTTTKVRSEQPDSDPRHPSYSALGAGTVTNTRVASEQGDKDRTTGVTTIPRRTLEMATKTITTIFSEICDNDPGRILHRILPRCF
jgi:hypothetical protein